MPRLPAALHAPILVVENENGRRALLDRAQASLGADECLVKITDIVGTRRSVVTTPTDPRAVLVAKEVPIVLRGGLTSLVSYYRVPADALGAREEHRLHGEFSHAYDVTLHVARTGTRRAAAIAA